MIGVNVNAHLLYSICVSPESTKFKRQQDILASFIEEPTKSQTTTVYRA